MKPVSIPSDIFKNRDLAVLESLVKYLKEDKDFSYAEIADLLNRDDRTIWTVYSRAKKKLMSPNDKHAGKKKK